MPSFEKKREEIAVMVRELSEQDSSSSGADQFATDDEVNRRINEEAHRLYGILVEVRAQEYYHAAAEFTSLAGQERYELPVRLMQLLGARVSDGNTERQMRVWSYQQLAELRNMRNNTSGSGQFRYFHYRLQGRYLNIQPAPATSDAFTFYLDYIPQFDELVNDDSTFAGINGWEKWIALGAGVEILNKEESYEQAQILQGRQDKLETQIRNLAAERDAGLPHGTQDTRRDWPGRRRGRRWTDEDGFTWRR